MSVFTPGHFTDLTGDAEAESGWQTPDERKEPRRDVRERQVRRERDTGEGEGPVARDGGNNEPRTGEPHACKGNKPRRGQAKTGQDNGGKQQKEK